MSGRVFARALRHNPEIKADFYALLAESMQRYIDALIAERDHQNLYRLQGQIVGLAEFKAEVSLLSTLSEERD